MESKTYLKFLFIGVVTTMLEFLGILFQELIRKSRVVYDSDAIILLYDQMYLIRYIPIFLVLLGLYMIINRFFSSEERSLMVENKFNIVKLFLVGILPMFLISFIAFTLVDTMKDGILTSSGSSDFVILLVESFLYLSVSVEPLSLYTGLEIDFFAIDFFAIVREFFGSILRNLVYLFPLIYALVRQSSSESSSLSEQTDQVSPTKDTALLYGKFFLLGLFPLVIEYLVLFVTFEITENYYGTLSGQGLSYSEFIRIQELVEAILIFFALLGLFLVISRLFSDEERSKILKGKFTPLTLLLVFVLPIFVFSLIVHTQWRSIRNLEGALLYFLLFFPESVRLELAVQFVDGPENNFMIVVVEVVASILRGLRYFFFLLLAIVWPLVGQSSDSIDTSNMSETL